VPFHDRYPFKRGEGRRRRNIAIGSSIPQTGPTIRGPGRQDAPAGSHAQYRLLLTSMPVQGLPEVVTVGRVAIHQADGPVWTQRTHVLQKPGLRPTFLKHMDQGVIELARGYRLTVCTIDVTVPDDTVVAIREWRDEALAALAFLVAVLDERIAQEVLGEDLLVFDDVGAPSGAVDQVTQVRRFVPKRVLQQHRQVLSELRLQDPAASSPVVAAARWYLRAAQGGVTPDGVVFLWIALEALAKPAYGTKLTKTERKLSDVEWVERALRDAGVDPTSVEPTVGRLAGLRAEIVHGGVETPALLRDGYYALEILVRALLRHRMDVGPMAWPIRPGNTNLRRPLALAAKKLQRHPRTRWRNP
jgi:hypothetical protein